jgi:hypothetical protein
MNWNMFLDLSVKQVEGVAVEFNSKALWARKATAGTYARLVRKVVSRDGLAGRFILLASGDQRISFSAGLEVGLTVPLHGEEAIVLRDHSSRSKGIRVPSQSSVAFPRATGALRRAVRVAIVSSPT